MPEKGGLEMMIIISVQERLITAVSMTCRLQHAWGSFNNYVDRKRGEGVSRNSTLGPVTKVK